MRYRENETSYDSKTGTALGQDAGGSLGKGPVQQELGDRWTQEVQEDHEPALATVMRG